MLRFVVLLSLFMATGCIETAVMGTVGTVGAVAAQERSVGRAVDDTEIFWKIKQLYLNKNAQDLLAGVGVEVIEGRVHLTGTVKAPETRIDAVRLAWKPQGVKEVINEIQVTDTKTLKGIAQDKWIQSQVIGRLILEKDLRSANYSVEVVNNIVYLMGIAQDTSELDKATAIASTIKGVERVVSHVILKNDASRS